MGKCCPKCGGISGYTTSAQVSGTVYMDHVWEPIIDSLGKETNWVDNSQMYDSINYKAAKYARCHDCCQRIDIED